MNKQWTHTHSKDSQCFCTLSLVIMAIASIFFWGCEKNPTGTDDSTKRDLNTSDYHEQALKWNASENRWEFFSWLGTRGADGCEIHINVHDGAGSVPGDFNSSAAKEALINARDIWKQAIREAGITYESVTRFESDGQALLTSLPRIDVYFVRQVNSGSNRGTTGINENSSTRQFSQVEISIATEYRSSGKTKNMNRDDYMSTLAHEFGHAVGIYCFGSCQGHSPNNNDVMYSPSRHWTLSDGDKATISAIYQGNAYYKPQGGQSAGGSIWVRHTSAYPGSIAFELSGTSRYEINPGQTIEIPIPTGVVLSIWECVGSNCRWDSYSAFPKQRYKIIDAPNSTRWNLTLVNE